jgi:hypothetical protein
MKSFYLKRLVIVVLVTVVVAMAIGGCGGSGAATTTATTRATAPPATATTTTTMEIASIPLDELSTFESKDPFIQQAQATTTVTGSTTTGTGATTTTAKPGTTTTTRSGTTSTTVPTTVTSPTHKLKILSIDVITGTPVVTFQVDGTVYADKKVGDSVSTAWGGIKVLAIDPQAQTVTLLHGSEVRTLGVGQQILK